MVQTITISNTAVRFKSSAALPVVYRDLTGREFFDDLQHTNENISTAYDMAYVMYKHANPEADESKLEWLEKFELADLNNAIPELVNMLAAETKTASAAKKNNAK